jgi:hypothetical protein
VTVAGKTVCQNCVAAIRARVSGNLPASGAPVAAGPDYNYYSGTSGSEYSYKPAVSTVEDVEDLHAPPTATGFLMGSALGLVAGVACAFLYEKFIFLTHINISYIAIESVSSLAGQSFLARSGAGSFPE